jgi:hypothetical protein
MHLVLTSRCRRPRADQAHGHRPAVLHLASCVSLTDRHSHAIESSAPLILGGRGVGTRAGNVQRLVSSAGSDITVWFERGKDETLPTRRTCDGLNSDYCIASIHDPHSILLRVVPCFMLELVTYHICTLRQGRTSTDRPAPAPIGYTNLSPSFIPRTPRVYHDGPDTDSSSFPSPVLDAPHGLDAPRHSFLDIPPRALHALRALCALGSRRPTPFEEDLPAHGHHGSWHHGIIALRDPFNF